MPLLRLHLPQRICHFSVVLHRPVQLLRPAAGGSMRVGAAPLRPTICGVGGGVQAGRGRCWQGWRRRRALDAGRGRREDGEVRGG